MQAVLIAFVLIFAPLSADAQSRQPPDGVGRQYADGAATNQRSGLPSMLGEEERAAQRAEREAREQHDIRERQQATEERNFFLTLLIAGAAIFQAILTFVALWFTSQQHRAYMTFETVTISPLEVGKPVSYEITFKNTGLTPARNVTGVHELGLTLPRGVVWPDMRRAVPKDGPRRDIGAGGTTFFAGVTSTPLDEFDMLFFTAGKGAFVVHGRVEYRDIFFIKRWVHYRMRGTPNATAANGVQWWAAEDGNESN